MTGPKDTDENDHEPESHDFGGLYGPTKSDMERFNRDDAEYLDQRKRDARTALWKLVAGAIVILFAAAMILNVLGPAFGSNRTIEVGPERVPATVTQVFDGRTISVQVDGIEQTVRYIGVETPPFGDPFYQLAIDASRQLLLGQEVLLEADEMDRDRQGRLLRYVWLDGGMINHSLIASGFSRQADSGVNTRYSHHFANAEAAARADGIGIWEPLDPERSAGLAGPSSRLLFGPA